MKCLTSANPAPFLAMASSSSNLASVSLAFLTA